MTRRPVFLICLLLGPPLAFLTPLLEVLGTLGISVFARPSLALAGGLVVLGALLGSLMMLLAPSSSSGRARIVFFSASLAVTVVVAFDIAIGGHAIISAVLPASIETGAPVLRRTARVAAMAGLGGGAFMLVWLFRRAAAGVLLIAAASFFLTTIAANTRVFSVPGRPAPPPRQIAATTSQPPFVYILLDEAMGIEGLKTVEGADVLATEIRTTAERHGFRVHGGAFSRHYTSGRSIPNALNFDFNDDRTGTFLSHVSAGKIESALFRSLFDQRYQIVGYRTDHIDFCFDGTARCETLPSFDPYSTYMGTEPGSFAADEGLKAEAALFFVKPTFVNSYVMYNYIEWLSTVFEGRLPDQFYALDAYEFPRWFERFAADVVDAPLGRAYFAHLLIPHAPYVFDADCRETGRAPIGYFLLEQRGMTGQVLHDTRSSIYEDYLRQYRCAWTRISSLLARMDTMEEFRNATVVIHGDHGARISEGLFVESVGASARALVDNHSALFAIRRPGLVPGYDTRKTSVQRLTAEYFSGRAVDELGPDNLTVVLDSADLVSSQVVPMPDFGEATAVH